MKSILFAIITVFSLNSFATVDGLTEGWIVVEDVQEEGVFTVMKVPIMGCWGLNQGPQLVQFTEPHNIKSTMGCGSADTSTTDINALSCATVVESKETAAFDGFAKIVLDISKCQYKNNANFITMVRTAAARNFPQLKDGKPIAGKEVELVLKK